MFSLEGKTAIVTGGASGIGLAISANNIGTGTALAELECAVCKAELRVDLHRPRLYTERTRLLRRPGIAVDDQESYPAPGELVGEHQAGKACQQARDGPGNRLDPQDRDAQQRRQALGHRPQQRVAGLVISRMAFDFGLALLVLAVAGWTIAAQKAFAAVVGFVAYGILLALVWVRLAAVEIGRAHV